MLSRTPGLYLPDASNIPAPLQVVTTKDVSKHCLMSPGEHNCPQLTITELDIVLVLPEGESDVNIVITNCGKYCEGSKQDDMIVIRKGICFA